MSKFIYLFILMLFTNLAIANDAQSRIDLVYSGMKFSIPSDPVAIGSLGDDENFLVLRYGQSLGDKFIGFSTVVKNPQADLLCKVSDFYRDVFNDNKQSKCAQDQLHAFKLVFMSDGDYGEWNNKDLNVFYTVKDNTVILFVINGESVIQIKSDFMTKQEMKRIVKKLL